MQVAVSAVIVNYNSGSDLTECVRSLTNQEPAPAEIIVVDNASSDTSLESTCAVFPEIICVNNPVNKGFAEGANDGGRTATGDVLLFLNPDIVLAKGSLAIMIDALSATAGVVGPRLVVESDLVEEYGATLDLLGHPIGLGAPGHPLYVSGCALATPRVLFDRLGGFDERYFMFVEDVDYCWRVLLTGGDVIVAAEAKAFHRGGAAAPGGYVRSHRLITTTFRVSLRERNTLATFLKCAPTSSLFWLVPTQLTKCTLVAIAALLLGRPGLARDLMKGLAWNSRQWSETRRRRRETPRMRPPTPGPMGRLVRRIVAMDLVLRFGFPRFADNPGSDHSR